MAISKITQSGLAEGAGGPIKSTTAPSSPSDGDMWFDTTNKMLKFYDGTKSDWAEINSAVPVRISGGTEVEENGYRYHIFKSSGTLTVESVPTGTVNLLVVAGGGSSGEAGYEGGGGAGGYIDTTVSLSLGSYSITVGAGGAKQTDQNTRGNNGENSVAFGNTAIGGGGGASYGDRFGNSGGSGGGDAGHAGGNYGEGTVGQGNRGGSGSTYGTGGGGGAGAVGGNGSGNTTGGLGGDGLAPSWMSSTVASSESVGDVQGTAVYFAGGGAGTNGQNSSALRTGGLGGGGSSSGTGGAPTGTAGSANTGGGGSGGEAGGSGIVIIRYSI